MFAECSTAGKPVRFKTAPAAMVARAEVGESRERQARLPARDDRLFADAACGGLPGHWAFADEVSGTERHRHPRRVFAPFVQSLRYLIFLYSILRAEMLFEGVFFTSTTVSTT